MSSVGYRLVCHRSVHLQCWLGDTHPENVLCQWTQCSLEYLLEIV